MTLTMFDVGEIETAVIECTAEDKPELHVTGENGRVTISLDEVNVGYFSRRVVIPARLPCGMEVNVFDVRLLALFLECEHGLYGPGVTPLCADPCVTREVDLVDKTRAWRIVKRLLLFENGGCALDFGYGQEVWVNAQGEPVNADGSRVVEPLRYFGEMVTALAFGIRNNPIGTDDLLEGIPELAEMMHHAAECRVVNITREHGINGYEFKTLYAYYEAIVRTAKTINRHIEKGDFKPNAAKLDAFEVVDNDDRSCIEDCAKRCDYARHLLDCRMSISTSKDAGYQLRVGHVHRYNPLRFPDTKIWWE